jgi:proteasome activator-like protein
VTAGEDGPQPSRTAEIETAAKPPAVVERAEPEGEAVASPAKVMRIGAMVRQLLEEVRQAPLDEASRTRMAEIYDISVKELAQGLSPVLADELGRIALPLSGDTPSEAELRVAQAQLVGWLEGLFHGIQATLFAQQMAAKNQLVEMRRSGGMQVPSPDDSDSARSGQYL